MTDIKYPTSFNGRWKNFGDSELKCKHTGLLCPNPEFIILMDKVQILRQRFGKSIVVSSAYRHPTHPIEAQKAKPGQHSIAAIDLKVSYSDAHELLRLAMELGFTGIGIQQKGSVSSRFIHLDLRENRTVWSY